MATAIQSAADFLQEFLMARESFKPADFGIDMKKKAFVDALMDDFAARFHGTWTVDEMVVHPREALAFCDSVRLQHKWFYLPDDIILRSMMNRRKSP